ncbi:MAG: hypothetical protein DMG11_10195, partial [Acidobacteria bacterium]
VGGIRAASGVPVSHSKGGNLNKGIASFNQRHEFSTNFLYQLPFGSGKAFGSGATGWVEKLIGNWQWDGILSVRSGYPIVPLVGSNRSGNGDQRNPDVPNWNPDFKGKVILGVDGFKKTGNYFDPDAFSLPLAGTFGNVARRTFRAGLFQPQHLVVQADSSEGALEHAVPGRGLQCPQSRELRHTRAHRFPGP